MSDLPVYHVPGPPGEAGFVHGRALEDLLTRPFVEAYVARLAETNRCDPQDLRAQSRRWLAGLPAHFQEEIEGMGDGCGLGTDPVAAFLYADIARPTGAESPGARARRFNPAADPEPPPGEHDLPADDDAEAERESAGGPMCSGVAARLDDGAAWIARNCDWLIATLTRGTAAVAHAAPNRIPIMAVGIRGDIDVDTGINAERLWLHLHTLPALDDPPRDRTCISWLFWAREALETCATIDEVERFIERTARDRGVLAIVGDGKTNGAAVFECSKGGHVRRDADLERPVFATNHTIVKEIDAEREAKSRAGSTVGRFCAIRARLRDGAPRRGPDDLIDLLADPGVEMRTPVNLRTIYSAVAQPAGESVWFASGGADGRPAASGGRWARVKPPWRSRGGAVRR